MSCVRCNGLGTENIVHNPEYFGPNGVHGVVEVIRCRVCGGHNTFFEERMRAQTRQSEGEQAVLQKPDEQVMLPRLCKDCKWSEDFGDTPRHPSPQWVCSNEKAGSRIDVVDGRRIYIDCHKARSLAGDGACGHDGKLWEPRQ